LEKRVAEKQADSLRLLVDVGGHRPFLAAFRNRAEIVLAHVNRQSPKSAALALAHRPHSVGRCRHVLSLHSEQRYTHRVSFPQTRSRGSNLRVDDQIAVD
jgi:hypothetical protein